MIKRIIGLVLILSVTLSTSVLAAEPGNGTIEGKIVNRTAGSSSSVANIEVKLTTYLNDAESGSVTVKSQSDGQFVVNNLATAPGYSHQASFTYQEAEYASEKVSFAQGETSKSFEVPVYDATNSAQAIKVSTAHTVIYVGEGSLDVKQYYLFTNNSDRAYIGSGDITATGKRKTLGFSYPASATDIQYGDGLMQCCVLPGQEGFTDTMPVLPEGREIVYGYTLKYSGESYDFSQKVNFPVGQYNLLVQGAGVRISSNQLASHGPVDMGEGQFSYSAGDNLTPGTIVKAQLVGLPKVSNQKSLIWIVLVLVVLAAASSYVYLRRRGGLQPQPVSSAGGFEQRRRRLLTEIARLDDDFESGKMQEDAYQQQRTAKKAELVRLMKTSKRG